MTTAEYQAFVRRLEKRYGPDKQWEELASIRRPGRPAKGKRRRPPIGIVALLLLVTGTVISAEDWRLYYEYRHIDTSGSGLKKSDYFDEDGGLKSEKVMNVAVNWPIAQVTVHASGSCLVADRQVVTCLGGQNGGQVKIKVDASRSVKDLSLEINEVELDMSGYDKCPSLKHSQRYNDFKIVNQGHKVPICRVATENERESLTRISILILRFELSP